MIPANTDLQRCAQVFFGCHPFIFFEGFYEVAHIVEPAAHADISDGTVGGGQLKAGLFNSVIIEVIYAVKEKARPVISGCP